ncbi:MAG: hypothetical protein O7C58_05835 [Rickettsia endosymbiont of Ixodes persulcatus]|nr:hypothetical protein [Rickettsia endosymbiont of Ixodes persulcatus]
MPAVIGAFARHKSHNVTVLIYHLVTPAKYRRAIFDKKLDNYLYKISKL